MSLAATSRPSSALVFLRVDRFLPSAIVGVAVYFLLMATASQLLNDPDTQWHVAVGRWILDNGRVPTTDVFSHTFAGAPWIAKEWGAQLIFAKAFALAGWPGVVGAAALSIAAAFAMLHAFLLARLRFSAALALTLVVLMLAAPHFLARPHVLVLPVLVLWTLRIVKALERRQAPPLALALLMVVWVNLHGSFPIGLVIAGALAGEGVFGRPRAERLQALHGWGFFLAAGAAATLVSPYGWHAVLVPLQMAAGSEALPFIAEWQPLHLDVEGILALLLLAVAVWSLAGQPRANFFRIIFVLLLAAMMIRHSRFIGTFAFVTPILAAATIAARFKLDPTPDRAGGPMSLAALGILGLASIFITAVAAPAPAPKMSPEAAFAAATTANVEGAVYNDYDFGGFLIAHGVKTFVDGRTDQLFLGGFLPGLDKALRATSDNEFARLLAHYKVGWALVRPGSDDARHLAHMPGWTRLYQDEVAAVFALKR